MPTQTDKHCNENRSYAFDEKICLFFSFIYNAFSQKVEKEKFNFEKNNYMKYTVVRKHIR